MLQPVTCTVAISRRDSPPKYLSTAGTDSAKSLLLFLVPVLPPLSERQEEREKERGEGRQNERRRDRKLFSLIATASLMSL